MGVVVIQLANLTDTNVSLKSQLSHQDNHIQALNKSVKGTKVIESQPASNRRNALSQHFKEYVAPHVENCHVFEDEEEQMEVQEKEDADE